MRVSIFSLLAATAMAFVACSDDNEPTVNDSPVAVQVYAGINAVQSRAADTSWDIGDEIGITTETEEYNNMQYRTGGNGNFEHVDGSSNGIFFKNSGSVRFSAYYPFYGTNGVKIGNNVNPDGVIRDVTTEDQRNQKRFDFLYASASASREMPMLSFTGSNTFSHKMTRLIINVMTDADSGFDAGDVKTGTYYISGIKHSGTFDTINGIATATGESVSDWQINATAVDKDNMRTYSLILYPQSEASLTFKANIAGQNYVSQAITPALEAGKSYSYTITVKKTGL